MKRLVYSPKISAYVKTDYGIIDASPYITKASVTRKLDQVSPAEITIRNPNKKWTDHSYRDTITNEHLIGPIFHPMDPITVIMTRLQNRPIQVFTGFLDKTPYLQLFPGTVTLKASCTLKKFLHTFYDAGLPFFNEFLAQYGWESLEGIGIVNPKAEENTAFQKGRLNDSGFGRLLYGAVNDIGGWPDKAIYIEEIPSGLIELVTNLFNTAAKESKESNKEMTELLHEIIGTATLGSGTLGGTPSTGGTFPVNGKIEGVSAAYAAFCTLVAKGTGISLRVLGAWCLAEGGPDDNPLNIGPGNHYGTVEGGAKATIETLHGSLYKGILDAAKNGSDQEQIKAIAASPWCPGCAGYEELILGTYQNVKINTKK